VLSLAAFHASLSTFELWVLSLVAVSSQRDRSGAYRPTRLFRPVTTSPSHWRCAPLPKQHSPSKCANTSCRSLYTDSSHRFAWNFHEQSSATANPPLPTLPNTQTLPVQLATCLTPRSTYICLDVCRTCHYPCHHTYTHENLSHQFDSLYCLFQISWLYEAFRVASEANKLYLD
jgi:hypothetical protein